MAGTLNQGDATQVTLAGGALPKNIFWQVAGAVTIGTTALFEGVILAKTLIAVNLSVQWRNEQRMNDHESRDR